MLEEHVRSKIMRAVPREDSKPELAVRKILHRLGLRFRLHRRDLAGTPDIVLPRHRAIIFVHGCFWHRHPFCKKASTPKARATFWSAKFERNVERDRRNDELLQTEGWRVLTVWECEASDPGELEKRLRPLFDLEADPVA
jgi:DNA mismatch endonuclease (patch repair protein)